MNQSQIESALREAEQDPSQFFGDKQDEVLHQWKVATHPDRWLGQEEVAKAWFNRFTELAEQSKNRIEIGGYRVVRKLADGDLCEVFIAKKGSGQFLIKRPTVKAASVMKKEMDSLAAIRAKANHTAKHLFPKPVESVDGCNVFEYADDLESVTSLISRYPDGVGGRHVGWLLKRMLLALTWAHHAGVVHGAVTTDHVLVCKKTHGIVLCDWIHSGKEGDPIKIVPKKHKDRYPDFAIKDKRMSAEMDIAMAGGIAERLAGTDCPRRILNFVRVIQRQSIIRSATAWDLHEEFSSLLGTEYGAPKFVELV